MVNKEAAAAAKAKGNADFQAKNFEAAIGHFTEAIKNDPTDHVFYSNRSACFASLSKYTEALEDGKKCVEIKADWHKGYARKGLAEFYLKKYEEAEATYKAGLKLAPEDSSLKEGLQRVMDAKYDVPSGPGMGGMTLDPSKLMAAAQKNPKIAEYMKDQQLMQKVNMLMQLGGQNQQMQQQMMMQLMQQDPRILEVFLAAQGMDVSAAGGDEMFAKEEPSAPPPPKKEEPKKEEAPDLRTPEQKEADEWKTKANAEYKKKNFKEAIELYDKAIAAEPNDLIYHNNKAAVYVELGELDKVLTMCQDLLDRRYEINSANSGGASFEKVAKVYNRMASVYEKQKEFDKAIEMYNKSLMEDNSRHTRNALRDLERKKEKAEKDALIDPAKAEEHNEKAKEAFKNNDWAKAKAEYDEAITRNPKDAKLYSNRAAAYTKLLAYPDALRDLDECLKLDPKFIKAYSRKGAAHFFMKEYNKALDAYGKGLAIDPANEECKNGREQVIAKIQESQKGQVDEEQVRHAMADPEIQNILKDPQINLFLKRLQENPVEAQKEMMKDVKLSDAVNKLMAAGILRTG
eukprot:gnl/MRDRNA2_/MRDRNA2_94073_c0_seq1.p1 gnl/MRDRNA2_/MRDRNA2_94073_c0~~gnl/MRDRNA2_/MRDRNA2_94073_c0_seq1.p1  ORF type:complete len:573 (-),score=192.98 gnl/MRDRNA2_/MRDRNA2_94073_c0_seq1:80-1798(-)